MSIKAIMEHEKYLRERRPTRSLSVAEIKNKIEEFVKERDKDDDNYDLYKYAPLRKDFYIREGKIYEREYLCPDIE